MIVHVVPQDEEHEHNVDGTECDCGPEVVWLDQETGLPWDDGDPIVFHDLFTPVDDPDQVRWLIIKA